MTEVYANKNTVEGSCGLGIFYNFEERTSYRYDSEYYNTISKLYNEGGCGFLIASFITECFKTDEEEKIKTCKKAYDQLKNKYSIIFQSEPRYNVNSGNTFFFCVYDTGDEKGFDGDRDGHNE